MDSKNAPGSGGNHRKRISVVLAAALLLLAGLFGLFLFLPTAKQGEAALDDVAAYVPENAVGLLTLTHLDKLSAGFAATPLGRFLAKDSVRAMLSDLGGDDAEREAIAQAYGRIFDETAETLKNPAFRAVFGDDVTLALLPPDAALLKNDPAKAMERSLVLYATTKAGPVAQVLGVLVPGVSLDKEQVEGMELTRIQVTDGGETRVFHARNEGGVLLMALDWAPIVQCLKANKEGATLKRLAGYQEADAFWKSAGPGLTYERGWCNVAALVALLPQLEAGEQARNFHELLQGLEYGYNALGKGARGLESRGRLSLRYEALGEIYRATVDDNAGAPPPPLGFLKDDSLLFEWESGPRPELLMEHLTKNIISAGLYADLQNEVRDNLGMSLEDLLAAFGAGYGLVVNDLKSGGLLPFPIPEVAVFARVRDRAKMDQAVQGVINLVAREGLQADTRTLADRATLHTWPLPLPVPGLLPTLVLNDRMLFIGSSQEGARPFLAGKGDVNEPPAGLQALLGSEWSARAARAHNVYLARPAKIADKAQNLLTTLSTVLGKDSALARELIRLLGSTDLALATVRMDKKSLDYDLILLPTAASATPAGTPASGATPPAAAQ